MSEEKKYTKTEEICEEIKNLTEEDLENVTGGITKAPEFKAGKALKDNTR